MHLASLAGGAAPFRRTVLARRTVPNASHGVFQRLPLRRRQVRASTPGSGPHLDRPEGLRGCGGSTRPRGVWTGVPSPSARRCQPPDSFRPCRSSRLRRFALLELLQVCCTLQPTMGFTTFHARSAFDQWPSAIRTLPKEALAAPYRLVVRRAPQFPWCIHPSERSPHRQPHRVTTADALSSSGALDAALLPSRRRALARPVATPPTSRP